MLNDLTKGVDNIGMEGVDVTSMTSMAMALVAMMVGHGQGCSGCGGGHRHGRSGNVTHHCHRRSGNATLGTCTVVYYMIVEVPYAFIPDPRPYVWKSMQCMFRDKIYKSSHCQS